MLLTILPQILYIILLILGLGLIKRTKEKTTTYNVGSSLFAILLVQLLYWWGGFYNQFELPQAIVTGINIISLGVVSYKHGEEKVEEGWTWLKIIFNAGHIFILYCGHFFDPIINLFK